MPCPAPPEEGAGGSLLLAGEGSGWQPRARAERAAAVGAGGTLAGDRESSRCPAPLCPGVGKCPKGQGHLPRPPRPADPPPGPRRRATRRPRRPRDRPVLPQVPPPKGNTKAGIAPCAALASRGPDRTLLRPYPAPRGDAAAGRLRGAQRLPAGAWQHLPTREGDGVELTPTGLAGLFRWVTSPEAESLF